ASAASTCSSRPSLSGGRALSSPKRPRSPSSRSSPATRWLAAPEAEQDREGPDGRARPVGSAVSRRHPASILVPSRPGLVHWDPPFEPVRSPGFEDRMRRKPLNVEMMDDAMANVLRAKTPAERLAIASGLWCSASRMIEAVLRAEQPDWTD